MKKHRFPLAFILGICLVLLSLGLMALFQLRMHAGARESRLVASKMAVLLPERTTGVANAVSDPGMPVLQIRGTDYAALLEIPLLNVRVPVADRWEGQLAATAGRFWGSVYDCSLVLGGPDQPGLFDFCDDVDIGTQVIVTDMAGARFSYLVSRVDRAKHADTPWLTEADCDLTLFCHDIYSMEYIAVRCMLSSQKIAP